MEQDRRNVPHGIEPQSLGHPQQRAAPISEAGFVAETSGADQLIGANRGRPADVVRGAQVFG